MKDMKCDMSGYNEVKKIFSPPLDYFNKNIS